MGKLGWIVAAALLLAACAGKGGADRAEGDFWLGGDWEKRTDLSPSEPLDLDKFPVPLARAETRDGSMVRGQVDLGATPVRYLAPAAEAAPAGGWPAEKEALAVVEYGPSGELPMESRQGEIHVMFNLPMVPLARLGEPIASVPFFKIDPPVAGTFRWYGTRVLGFQPAEPLIAAPKYTVTVGGDAASLGGRRLDKPLSFDIYAETLKAVNFWLGADADRVASTDDAPPEASRAMVLEFNQEVDPAYLKQFLSLRAGDRDLPFSLERPKYPERLKTRTPRAVLLKLDAEPPRDSAVSLVLADKASPKAGYPARKGEQKFEFHTLRPFAARELNAWSWDAPDGDKPGLVPVYLELSHKVDPKAALGGIALSVNGKPAKPESAVAFDRTVRLGLRGLQPGDKVAVKGLDGVRDVWGRPAALPPKGLALTMPAPGPRVDFPDGFRQLESQYAPKFIWEGRNLDQVGWAAQGAGGFGYDLSRDPVDWAGLKPASQAGWRANKTNYNLVDLKPWLGRNGLGTVYFKWRADYGQGGEADSSSGTFAVQVTDLGISTRYAYNRVLVWVNSLKTGRPVADAAVVVAGPHGGEFKGRTDGGGLAAVELPPGAFAQYFNKNYGYDLRISASKDGDRCDLRASDTHYSWTASSYGSIGPDRAERPRERLFMFTDRGLYKPGEEIALRGIHWTQTIQGFKPREGEYQLALTDPRDNSTLWSATGRTSMSGGFAQRLKLPAKLEPGSYSFRYIAPNEATGKTEEIDSVSFTIAQFRRLNFQVSSAVPERSFTMGDDLTVQVKASYLAGGAMPEAPASWYWTRKPTAFMPPGPEWKNYVFGPGNWEGEHNLTSGKGRLSGGGELSLREKSVGQNAAGSAYDYTVETTVSDVDRQSVSSTAHLLVHPAAFYVGAKFASSGDDGWWSRFVSTGQTVKVQLALVTPEGKPYAAGAKLSAAVVRGDWKESAQQGVYGRVNTRWEYVETEVQRQSLNLGGGAGDFSFSVKDSGDYLLNIEGVDGQGRLAKTTLRFYASGSAWVLRAQESPSDITMILDKDEYLPGETARILVRSPVADGRYLMTVEREGILEQKLVDIKGGQSLLEVPVKAGYVPVFYVSLTSYTKREGAPKDYFEPDLGKPRGLYGYCGVKVSTKPVELDVEVQPLAASYKPGEKAEVAVRVTRAGKPVANAEVSILAVDRGVLDLIDYHVPNPVAFFYDPGNFPLGVHGDDSRRQLMKPVAYDTNNLIGGGGDGDKEKTRRDFRPLALFQPFVATDKNGIAKVSFQLPDNLTTYRLTALALRENRLGIKEGELLVQNPVNVRSALPRRWRPRDTAAAGVVLQNLTRAPQKVEVSVESDILDCGKETKKTVEVPPGSVYELPFVLSASKPGAGSITFHVAGAALREKLVEQVTVEAPMTQEAFATVGYVPAGAAAAQEGLVLPQETVPGFGSLTLRDSGKLSACRDPARERLLAAPERWASWYQRLTHGFALVEAGKSDADYAGLLKDLAQRQQPDGGLYLGSYTFKPYRSDPFVSLVAAQLLAYAGAKAPADAPKLPRLLAYLETLKKPGKDLADRLDPYFHAYNALVLAQSGRSDRAYLDWVGRFEDKLGLGGYGLLAQAWLAAGDPGKAREAYQRCKNFLDIGTQTVGLRETYEAASWWSSGLAELALFLKNGVDLDEAPDLTLRVARSLNPAKRNWQNRNDDLWTLLAFDKIVQREQAAGGDGAGLVAKTGSTALASLKAGETKRLEFADQPLAGLPRGKALPLEISRAGAGELYYTSILAYALPSEIARPRDEGIEVTQSWTGLDGKAVAPQELKPGETYRVKVTVSTPKRRANLELLVPVPSGAEIVDPSFAVTGRFADKGGAGDETIERETVYGDQEQASAEGEVEFDGDAWYWYLYNPDSFALDNMMVYRWSDFYAGSRTVSFLVRVTTPGIYPTPPAQARLEFEPEVFGRDGGKLFAAKP